MMCRAFSSPLLLLLMFKHDFQSRYISCWKQTVMSYIHANVLLETCFSWLSSQSSLVPHRDRKNTLGTQLHLPEKYLKLGSQWVWISGDYHRGFSWHWHFLLEWVPFLKCLFDFCPLKNMIKEFVSDSILLLIWNNNVIMRKREKV